MLFKTFALIAAFYSLYFVELGPVEECSPNRMFVPALHIMDDSGPPSTRNEYLIHYYFPPSASSTFFASSSSTLLLSSVVVVEREIDMFYSSSLMEAPLPHYSYTV